MNIFSRISTPSFARTLLLLYCFLFSGCLVRSVNPWLTDETQAAEPNLRGAWIDEEESAELFFLGGQNGEYSVLMIENRKERSSFSCTLHQLENALFLVVTIEEKENLESFAILPVYLLFKVEYLDDFINIYPVDLNSFEERTKGSNLRILEGSSSDESFVLLSKTEELEAFVRTQHADTTFFDSDPLYSLKRVRP